MKNNIQDGNLKQQNNSKQPNNTKQQIQETALDLFSKYGYSAVSIRDIGKIVGVKESTIYYHFKNKQDIFQSILAEVQEITNQMAQVFDHRFQLATHVEEQEFVLVGLGFLQGYLLNEHILKVIRMLMIEQCGNKEAAQIYQKIIFEAPLEQNTMVFQQMMEKNIFRRDDPERLAKEYYGLIYFTFMHYFSGSEVTTHLLWQAKNDLTDHLTRFYRLYLFETKI